MVDRNLQKFYGRVGRIERTHKAGGGFEAEGTLGMSHYNARKRPARLRLGWLMPLVLVLAAVVVIKASVFALIGSESYGERMAAIPSDTTLGAIETFILQPDPLTRALAAQIVKYLP
ncbi:hypothetical protein [Albidovulum sp.]|uniref:hypothetical protein n=1 Tax=Albidovulum sp. TaxID=1872424 RepID=UPI001DD366F8|nr:hypothetical protein [Paracoccaceae bacterium]